MNVQPRDKGRARERWAAWGGRTAGGESGRPSTRPYAAQPPQTPRGSLEGNATPALKPPLSRAALPPKSMASGTSTQGSSGGSRNQNPLTTATGEPAAEPATEPVTTRPPERKCLRPPRPKLRWGSTTQNSSLPAALRKYPSRYRTGGLHFPEVRRRPAPFPPSPAGSACDSWEMRLSSSHNGRGG